MAGLGEGLGFVAGIALGSLLGVIDSGRLRRVGWIVASLALGAWVSWMNGEWAASPAFLVFDVPMVALSALGASILVRRARKAPSLF